MIKYQKNLDGIKATQLQGFFVGWQNSPSEDRHLELLKGSSHIVLALDDESSQVVGFITAISDGVLSAYIPFLEVLPGYQKQGIGNELVGQMREMLKDFYMIDLTCDEDMQKWYERAGLAKSTGMSLRNYDKQAGV